MTQYINKDALVTEVERRIKETESMQPKFDQFWAGQISAFKGVLKILDTIEVKEEYIENDFGSFWGDYIDSGGDINNYEVAKHFFELVRVANSKAQKGESV